MEFNTMRKANLEDLISLLVYPQLRTEALDGLRELGDRRVIPYLIEYAKKESDKSPYLSALLPYNCEEYLMDLLAIGLEGKNEERNHIEILIGKLTGIANNKKRIALSSLELQNQLLLGEVCINLGTMEFIQRCHTLIELIPTTLEATVIKLK